MADETREEEKQEEVAEEKAPKKSSTLRSKLVTVGIIIAVQLLVVSMAGKFLILPHVLPKAGSMVVVKEAKPSRGFIYLLENIIVNLNPPAEARYLKVTVGLEVGSEKAGEEVEARRPELRDAVIGVLSGKRAEDVATRQGKELAKVELKEKLDAVIKSGSVLNVYFSEFVVQ